MRLIDIEPILRRKLPLLVMLDEILSAPSIDIITCAECKHLEVLNTRLLYALCRKFGVDFEPFETDTRTHGCSWGERKEGE